MDLAQNGSDLAIRARYRPPGSGNISGLQLPLVLAAKEQPELDRADPGLLLLPIPLLEQSRRHQVQARDRE